MGRVPITPQRRLTTPVPNVADGIDEAHHPTSDCQSLQHLRPARGENRRPLPSALAQAALEGDLAGKVAVLASDPEDRLAAALARLGRAFMARDS
jgi:hypothetical protein